MLAILLNVFIFYLICSLSYFSIIGFGNIIKINNQNKFLYYNLSFLYGNLILIFFGFIFSLLNIKSSFVNLSFLLFGLIIFILNYKKDNKNFIFFSLLIILFLFSCLLISKPHDDFLGYHFSLIKYVSISKPILGIANIETHFVNGSFLVYLQKFFFLPYFNFKLIHIPIFLIYVNIVILLTYLSIKNINFFISIILIFLILKFTRLSEYGYDYPFNLVLLNLIVVFFNFRKEINFYDLFLIFVLAFLIKIIAIFFIPLLAYLLYTKRKDFDLFNINNYYIIALIIILILENIMRGGCFFLPFYIHACQKKYCSGQ